MATALDYYRDYQTALDTYNEAYELYSGQYDNYIGSFYMDGMRIPDAQFGGTQSLITQGGVGNRRFQNNFVTQTEQGFGTYARTGDIRQAELIENINRPGGYGVRGVQKKVYRDPLTGITYETPRFNTKQGVEFADGTFGFADGKIIGLAPEPEFTATAPTFDQDKFLELYEKPFTALDNQIEKEKIEIQKLQEKRRMDEEEFNARFAKLQRQSAAELETIQAETEEAQASVARQQELLESETNEILKRTGRKKTAMVRARTLRGRPILSGENA